MKKYSVYIWLLIALIFMGFIGIMSYWYPVTFDEYFRWNRPIAFVYRIKEACTTLVPRISTLFAIAVFALGKTFFILFNPIIQLLNCLLIFYIVFLRFPIVKTLKDIPYFLIILCMSIFFVSRPSEVMFWVSGATNYSWSLFFLLLFFCFLRQMQAQKFAFKDTLFVKLCFFILGFIVGMSNESLSPIALGFVVCFGVFSNLKNIKMPRALSYMIFGTTIGCLVFFSAPAHYYKVSHSAMSNLATVSIGDKLFFHINHFNNFFKTQFALPIITTLFLIIAFLDKSKVNVKKENLYFSIVFLILLFSMAFVLFVVPNPPLRAYYAASVMGIVAFLFLVRYYILAYEYNFSKILCYMIIFVSLCLMPRFVIPHYVLHIQEQIRNSLNFENQPKAQVLPYFVLKGPTENLTIGLTDPARRVEVKKNVFVVLSTDAINW